jgi:predicted AAA+ superfamily ATPase
MVEAGLKVTDFGMASTPAMFMSTVTEGYLFDGSVMFTASHLPFSRNGFKFFTANGGLEKADIKEILEYAKELNKEVSVTDYLVWGGFPKRFEFNSLEAQRIYLNDLDDTIVINDLIRRYKIRKESLFKSLVNYILRSNSRIFSAKSICDYIKREHESCSINTIMKYLDYLQEAYIIESVKQYSTKTKRELSYYAKIYNADVAFNSIRCIDNRFDLTHNLENIVYNELVYMGYDIMYIIMVVKKLIS